MSVDITASVSGVSIDTGTANVSGVNVDITASVCDVSIGVGTVNVSGVSIDMTERHYNKCLWCEHTHYSTSVVFLV